MNCPSKRVDSFVPRGFAALAAADALIRDRVHHSKTGSVVSIGGRGGSGKSTLAARLSGRFNQAFIVHTDDFASWDNPLGWWPRLLDQVLRPLREHRTARYQRYDWDKQALAEWIEIPLAPLILVEGVGCARAELRRFAAATIWVEAARDTCLRRGLERDGAAALGLWKAWQADEDRLLGCDPIPEAVDLIVSGENGEPWSGPTRPDKIV